MRWKAVDLLLTLLMLAAFRSLRPIARMAVAYPLKSRFRTGVTMVRHYEELFSG